MSMANNRMGIACPCGGYIGVAKHFGSDWSVYNPDTFAKRLEEFLSEHRWCVSRSDGTHFALTYEQVPQK